MRITVKDLFSADTDTVNTSFSALATPMVFGRAPSPEVVRRALLRKIALQASLGQSTNSQLVVEIQPKLDAQTQSLHQRCSTQ